METSTILTINPDLELIRYLGLDEDRVRRFLGHTREALSKRRLTAYEIALLRLSAQVNAIPCNDEAILDYVARTRLPKDIEVVRAAITLITSQANLDIHQSIWIIMPDIKALIQHGRAQFLHCLPGSQTRITFFLSSSLAKDQLFAYLGSSLTFAQAQEFDFRFGSAVSSYESHVFGDPRVRKIRTYVPGKSGLVCESVSDSSMRDFARRLYDRTYL